MEVLVTGAAGYIGSVVTRQLLDQGTHVVALDNLGLGHRQAVDVRARFVKADLGDKQELDNIFSSFSFDAVVHLAAQSRVEDSMRDPQNYFNANLVCGISLFEAMLRHDVRRLVLSSSAAVYGSPLCERITESQPLVPPLNTYGESKIMLERILRRYDEAYAFRYVALRYFNAAGATAELGEDHTPETHLIPIVLRVALGFGNQISVFGNDYPTEDGSCVRDYVHVVDIANAHCLALDYLRDKQPSGAFNVGLGKGYSVLTVLQTAREVTGMNIPVSIQCRRAGDPPILIADAGLAASKLGWHPSFDSLQTIVESAWQWHKTHPHGYEEETAPRQAIPGLVA